MYASLDVIDRIAAAGDGDDPPIDVILTDHRTRAEIEADPDVSVLFALTRAITSRREMTKRGRVVHAVRYLTQHEPPAFLVLALASVGAVVEHGVDRVAAPAATPDPDVVVARAFGGLAARIAARTGLSDPAAVLRALEAEIGVRPPRKADDEVAYWTRVLELMAAFASVVRATRSIAWQPTDACEIPFGLALETGQIVVAGNRAMTFLEGGEDESMFRLVAALDELSDLGDHDPILPSLRTRADAIAMSAVWRPLARLESDAAPVIAYGHDGASTFRLIRVDGGRSADELHARALANLAAERVALREDTLGGLRVIVAGESWFAAEKLLDEAFVRELHRRLGAATLAIGVPRRGVLIAAAAGEPLDALAAYVADEFAAATGRAICAVVLLVRDGRVVDVARLGR